MFFNRNRNLRFKRKKKSKFKRSKIVPVNARDLGEKWFALAIDLPREIDIVRVPLNIYEYVRALEDGRNSHLVTIQ